MLFKLLREEYTSSMTEIINLRQARKAQRRAVAEQTAVANRARHGRTKAEKQKEALEKASAERILTGHQLSSANKDE